MQSRFFLLDLGIGEEPESGMLVYRTRAASEPDQVFVVRAGHGWVGLSANPSFKLLHSRLGVDVDPLVSPVTLAMPSAFQDRIHKPPEC